MGLLLPPLGQGNRYQHDGNRNLITKVQELTSSKELWFRAAVIAVPIAGGLILVLLIMLALRMLRSENKRLQEQRQQMLSRLHYSFHGHHSKKGQVAKLDLECMVPVSGHENCCLTCDKMRQADLSHDRILSLVHWGMYSGHGKLEFVWLGLTELDVWDPLEFCWVGALYLKKKLTRVIICERWNDLCKQHLGYFFWRIICTDLNTVKMYYFL